MNSDTILNALLRIAVPVTAIAGAVFVVVAVIDRMEQDNRAAERRALAQRSEQLTMSALAPGSALACLDAGAGEVTGSACEASIFASPQSTAAAVAYMSARLTLLAEAHDFDPANGAPFAAARRAIELDRYGIAAHVLALRDGCTPERCAAFAWLSDTNALKASLRTQAFEQYVSRHSDNWNAPAAPPPVAVSEAPAAPAAVSGPRSGDTVAHPVSSKYRLPSADSIPAVSIMNAEPPLPNGAAQALAAQPDGEAKPEPKAAGPVPVPPKRPQDRPLAQREQEPARVAR